MNDSPERYHAVLHNITADDDKLDATWSQPRLEACGHWWQERLFLGDWRTEFHLVGPDDLDINDGVRGTVIYHGQHRHAIIKIVDQTQLKEEDRHTIGEEEALVHELLHLHSVQLQWPYEHCKSYLPEPLYNHVKDDSDSAEEQMLNHLCRALVALKRQVE